MDELIKFLEIISECRIQRFKDVIFIYDFYSLLKREFVFFDGGFYSWFWYYLLLVILELLAVFWKFYDFDLFVY